MNRFLIPLGVFAALVAFLGIGLTLDPREIPSPLIHQPASTFKLAQLEPPGLEFSQKDMLGQVWLLNVWASWCVSCREEHPILLEFARTRVAPVVGLNYKDKPDDAKAWLREFGDPYMLSITDTNGRIGIDYGVYGVPETFLIDRAGIIRYKQIGPVTRDALDRKILPLIRKLQQS